MKRIILWLDCGARALQCRVAVSNNHQIDAALILGVQAVPADTHQTYIYKSPRTRDKPAKSLGFWQ